MPYTAYERKRTIDFKLDLGSYTPGTLTLSLHTASPGDAGSHAAEVSDTDSGYARQALADIMGSTDSTTGISVNTAAINFGPATSNWGTISYLAIEDETAGEMIWYGSASPVRTINDGLPFQIAAGELQLRLV